MTLELLKSVCDAFSKEGVTAVHVAALVRLNTSSVTIGELSKVTGHTAANATQLVDRLEAMKLAARQSSDEDRRITVVSITPAGRAKLDALKKAIR